MRGRTTEQERERPPTGLPRPAAARPAADAAPGSPASDESHAANATDTTRAPRTPAVASVTETPRRRGPSRAMIGVGLAVVLIVAAAWLLVSLPGVPGGADWAGGGDRNWPPGAPGGTPTSEQPLSAPPASAPFASPEPGRPTDNGLVATPRSPAAAAAAKPAGTTPAAGTSPSDAAPTTGAPVAPTPTGSPLNGGNGIAPGQVEAESFAWQWGVTAAALDGASGGRGVSAVSNGDWLRFDALDLGGARTFKVRIANGSGSSGRIEIRYDSPWSAPMASVSVDNTGGWSQWRTRSVSCTSATGSRTVYVSFVSRSPGDFVYLDWISFS
ncbi:carbohydrate-binding protein [Catenuloplanes indicus]|uniref:CBM6 domain-containing protein n=1 Tax=Catenuloplanes indicus TaxID=137267 RepID=A0AAE3VXM8_9ACTN|nr:carbohydrate-binding protein [Catenuloplanes indicus]MDQ0365619.1 hypothetical protein [Catenuloplanes indicus]